MNTLKNLNSILWVAMIVALYVEDYVIKTIQYQKNLIILNIIVIVVISFKALVDHTHIKIMMHSYVLVMKLEIMILLSIKVKR